MFESQSSRILDFHRFLLSQTGERLEKYERALQMIVKPQDVVLDLGTGVGILAVLAIRAGARHAYAIESSDSIDFARAIAASSGLADKITFLHGSSFDVDVPGRADVLVTDTFGTFGLQPGGWTAILDARQRLLTADARCIPQTIHLYAAPIEDEPLYAQTVDVWATRVRGVDLTPMRAFAVNTVYSARSAAAQILGVAPAMTRLMLRDTEDVNFTLDSVLSCSRSGRMHGLSCWFMAELADGICIDNAPGSSSTGYAHMFAPISAPIGLDAGDVVRVSVQGYDNLQLRWRVDAVDAHFDHSTFSGLPLSLEDIRLATAKRSRSRDSTSDTT
jgi:hypothetical protein